jgi:hypothetical protein
MTQLTCRFRLDPDVACDVAATAKIEEEEMKDKVFVAFVKGMGSTERDPVRVFVVGVSKNELEFVS